MRTRRLVLAALLLGVIAFTTLPRILYPPQARDPRATADAALRTAGALYAHHFVDARHERLFLGSLAFFLTFGLTPAITHAIRAGRGRSTTS